MSDKIPRILIAAGGTGGHIFPALHVAKAIAGLVPEAQIAFIGSGRPLEEKLIEGNGYRRFILPATRVMQQGLGGIFKLLLSLPSTVAAVRRLYREFKPDVVVGMGGYVSVMPVMVARLSGIPTWVHEAEIAPGLANKLLGIFSTKVSIAFQATKMLRPRELIYTAHPVRPELAGIAQNPSAARPQRLLIIGGSQGARSIDEAFINLAPELKKMAVIVHHQTRPENVEALMSAYGDAGLEATVVPFITDMADAYRNCDLVVSRAGAGAIFELMVVNRPAIVVPYPFAQGGHQEGNAQLLVAAGKGLMVGEGEHFAQRLLSAMKIIMEPEKYKEMRATEVNLKPLGAATEIASGILGLVSKSGLS